MSELVIKPGQIVTGSLFSEPMRVETMQANGPASWVVGLVGTRSERFRKVTLTATDIECLTILDLQHSYDGDGRLLRLGLQAYALGIAYEFDPYFGLSISRVDPLPHQLEAVYDYLLKLARVRFLLADDAGGARLSRAVWRAEAVELRAARAGHVRQGVLHDREDGVCECVGGSDLTVTLPPAGGTSARNRRGSPPRCA